MVQHATAALEASGLREGHNTFFSQNIELIPVSGSQKSPQKHVIQHLVAQVSHRALLGFWNTFDSIEQI